MSCGLFSSEFLKRHLKSMGVDAVSLRFEEHTMTVDAAARQLGVGRERIIKSLLFVDDTGLPVLAIVTGDKRVDEAKLAAVCNAKKLGGRLRRRLRISPDTMLELSHRLDIKR